MRELAIYGEVLIQASRLLEPYRVVDYLRDLSTAFHKFYTENRVLSEDPELSRARVFLIDCVRIVLRNGLEVLGISQPEKM